MKSGDQPSSTSKKRISSSKRMKERYDNADRLKAHVHQVSCNDDISRSGKPSNAPDGNQTSSDPMNKAESSSSKIQRFNEIVANRAFQYPVRLQQSFIRSRILEASMAKIKESGNKTALEEIQKRDQQLNNLLKRFESKQGEQKTAITDVSTTMSPDFTHRSPVIEGSAYSPFSNTIRVFSSTETSPIPIKKGGKSNLEEIDPPLENDWTIYYDRRGMKTNNPSNRGQEYENSLIEIGTISTVKQFWSHFNNLKPPTGLIVNANYHFFKKNIKPLWEDPENATGGKWTITGFSHDRKMCLNDAWLDVLLSLIGEYLEEREEVCGAVLSKRARGDRIAIWVRSDTPVESVYSVGKKLYEIVKANQNNFSLEFQLHSHSLQAGSSYHATGTELDLESLRSVFPKNN